MKPAVILNIAVLLVAGVAAYFTLEHNRKFGEVREVRQKATADNKAVSANAEAKERELKKEREALAAGEQKLEEATQALDAIKSSSASVQREAAELDDQLKIQQEEFAEINKTLEEVTNSVKDLGEGITLENLGDKIQEIGENKKTLEARLEELETLTATADKLLANNRTELDRLARREIEREARVSRNSLEAVVTAVNQDWGFVVIGAGANSGFSPQTPLLIKRDGHLIGRVKPSAVEPTQTIAEIDFDTIASGARIQPGDRVILAKAASN
jgi:hypothetical protein